MTLLDPLSDPELKRYIEETVGEKGLPVAAILARKTKATDTEIAEELQDKPSHIRRILYDLYEARVAEYHKEKDKATGWQTFIWSFSAAHAKYAMQQRVERGLHDIETQIRFEEANQFYVCPTDHRRFLFDEATDHQFHCPQCGSTLANDDNSEVIEALKSKLVEAKKAPARAPPRKAET